MLHMNNDVFIEKDTIKKLYETLKKYPHLGAVGAVQYYSDGRRNLPLSFFYRGDQDIGNVYKAEVTSDDLPYVEADIGGGFGCAMLRKEVWDKIGYYDETFAPCHYEQEDYCLRILEAGWKVACVPSAHCIHYVAQTTGFNLPYYQSVCNRNREIFRNKWGEKLRQKLV